jgi:tetraacyldisaccharide 4'-kinase
MKIRRPWGWPLVPLYAAGLAAKTTLRRLGILRTRELGWPVVSVGSLSAGGAGKTPVVIALAELLRQRGWYVDVLSRGYRRIGGGVERVDPWVAEAALHFGDEPVLIAQRSGVPVWVGAERFAAGTLAERAASAEVEADSSAALRNDKKRMFRSDERKVVHLLDDGFQHRQLARALDIVVVTAADLEDALLPAGNLRERSSALRRADAVVLREEEYARVLPRLTTLIGRDMPVWKIHRKISFPDVAPVLVPDVPTYGHIVFAAIARPANFVQMLASAGVPALEVVTFSDHHAYTVADMEKLVEVSDVAIGRGFVTTEKDAVKLSPEMRARLEQVGPLVITRLDCSFVDEESVARELEARLQ